MINQKISGTQFSVVVLLSSISFIASMAGSEVNENYTDSIVSILISCALGLVLSIPLLMVHGKAGFDQAREHFYLPTASVCGLYILYFLYVSVWDITSFISMLANTVFPELAIVTMLIAILVVCAYGAFKGVEAVGRSSLFILVAFLLGILLLIWGCLPLADYHKTRVLFYDGFSDTLKNVIPLFARSTFLPQAVILMSFAEGKVKGKYIGWSVAAGIFAALVLFMTQLCLGEYADTQEFPVYALSAASILLPLQRLDIIFNVIWFMIMILKVTATLLAASKCADVILKPKAKPWFLLAFCLAVGLFSYYLLHNTAVRAVVMSSWLAAVLAVILGGVVPLLMLSVYKILKKNREGA